MRSDSSSDEDIHPQISDGVIISSSLKKCSDKLLNNIKDLKDIVDIGILMPLLKQISNYKCVTKYKDPLLYISYVHDDYGYPKAAGYCRLSEYLALTVCGQKFIYSDILGKRVELDFDINDLEYEYADHEYSDDDTLDLNEERIQYDYFIYIKILEGLEKYMYTLPYVDIETYKISRYKELEEYVNKLFKLLILTTNPVVRITYASPEVYYIDINLSLYITYLCKEPDKLVLNVNKQHNKTIYNWSECKIKVLSKTETDYKNLDIIKYADIENKIKEILSTYEPLIPINFYNKNFEEILVKCQELFSK